MSDNHQKTDSPVETLKNEASRQSWELFHRAIAHAKESDNAALHEADADIADTECAGPLLRVVR